GHVTLELLDESRRRVELDVRVQVADEAQLDLLLVEVTLVVEQESLYAKLRTAERRPVSHRERGDELTSLASRAAGVRPERRHQLVGLDADVRGREAQRAADLVAVLDRTRNRVLAAEQPVRLVDL